MAGRASTPWGRAELVEEIVVPQRAGERRFSAHVQLLVLGERERLLRFAYSSEGSARRGPLTLRERELVRIGRLLESRPALAALLGGALASGCRGGTA